MLKPFRYFAKRRPNSWSRRFACVLFVSTMAVGMPDKPKDDPPSLPLERETPHIYSMRAHVNNKTHSIGWPLLPQTNWSEVDVATLQFLDGNGAQIPFEVEPVATNEKQWHATVSAKSYSVQWTTLAYSSKIHEAQAVEIAWPDAWSDELLQYLQPSRFIESGDEIFAKAVEDNGDPKSVSIHIAAKVLIRYCLQNIQSNGRYSQSVKNVTTGIDVKGARYAVKQGKGSASDLVCVCIATLRNAGIPARPVVGITNADSVGTKRIDPQFIVWGEYALPGAGWVPFFPERMRGTVDNLSRTESWQGLGTLPWLNRRIPIAWNFDCFDVDRTTATQNLEMNLVSSPN
ncbi:MAG: hypothetical protein ACI9JK_001020 [Phycisphaerales bacterium]|jgi:hypothetical protein